MQTDRPHASLVVLLVVLAIMVLGGLGFVVYRFTLGAASPSVSENLTIKKVVASPTPSAKAEAKVTTPLSPSASPTPALSADSVSDTKLDADLQSIDAGLTQTDANSSAAADGLNDKQTDLSS